MKGRFNQVVGAISIALALLTPIVAELSSYAENTNGQVPGQLSNASPIIYVGPVYAGSNSSCWKYTDHPISYPSDLC
jgi:hypothetical protein